VQAPGPATLVAMGLVAAGLLAIHLAATHATGRLHEPVLSRAAVTPATTLSLWWHHAWAGLFHKSWGHLAYNLAVFAAAFPFAARQQGPWATLGQAYWMGPFTVFTLHLLLVLPLAGAGVPYAVRALDVPLVGFSVMAYAMAGMALAAAPLAVAAAVAAGVLVLETASAVWVTAPFVSVYHVAGLGLGFWVRTLLAK
jgi:hypothetical protein